MDGPKWDKKVKLTSEEATKAQKEGTDMVLLFL